jgi:hypothetical protein
MNYLIVVYFSDDIVLGILCIVCMGSFAVLHSFPSFSMSFALIMHYLFSLVYPHFCNYSHLSIALFMFSARYSFGFTFYETGFPPRSEFSPIDGLLVYTNGSFVFGTFMPRWDNRCGVSDCANFVSRVYS